MNRLILNLTLILIFPLLTSCTLTVKGLDFENLAYEIGKTPFDCNSPLKPPDEEKNSSAPGAG
jgi:hypothetical protein